MTSKRVYMWKSLQVDNAYVKLRHDTLWQNIVQYVRYDIVKYDKL